MSRKFLKENVDDITCRLLSKAIFDIQMSGHNQHFPYGCRGEDYILYENSNVGSIILAMHNGLIELRIDSDDNDTVFSGHFSTDKLSLSIVCEHIVSIIKSFKKSPYLKFNNSFITKEDFEKMEEANLHSI